MAPRTELHEKLVEILGARNVYFQPPANIKMKFPAIEYHLGNINPVRADNSSYLFRTAYEMTLIEKEPDSEHIKQLLLLPYCSFDRSFVSDNLYHYIFTIYY